MAETYLIDIAVTNLDELYEGLQGIINKGGFDRSHKDIIWLIKGWMKIANQAGHPDYQRQAAAYYAMKRDPAPATGSRSKALLKNLEIFQTMLEKHRQTHGDAFNRVDTGMRDLVWEYRKHLAGQSATDFENKLMILRSLSKDQLMKEKMFKMDQHA